MMGMLSLVPSSLIAEGALLDREDRVHTFLRRDVVIVIRAFGGDLDLDPLHFPREAVRAVVGRHGGALVAPDLERLVARERQWLRTPDRARTSRLVIDEQPDSATLGWATAVIVELHAEDVAARCDLGSALDVEEVDAVEVVAIPRPSVLDVQRPAADAAALGDDHALAAVSPDLDLGGDAV